MIGGAKSLSLEEQLKALAERKKKLSAKEPAWNGRALRDREIALINAKIDELLDEWLTRKPSNSFFTQL